MFYLYKKRKKGEFRNRRGENIVFRRRTSLDTLSTEKIASSSFSPSEEKRNNFPVSPLFHAKLVLFVMIAETDLFIFSICNGHSWNVKKKKKVLEKEK
jgi:hypothetical protein